ncbi:MAG: RluA family pseudouridine synthase [Spirochaetaceae bacterium]|jgi:23S rRNA pseudouridine955/2504/2580 synthase|nr:RluA family pseudouridine synthase [Spirochaetaceae bacterium]
MAKISPPPILYQDDAILVINKPAGLAVQGGVGIVRSVDTVLAEVTGTKVFPVHRLDKDTSGILVVAKSAAAAAVWAPLLASGGAQKEYAALCLEFPPHPQGTLDSAVGKIGAEKSAVTRYRTLRTTRRGGVRFSLLAVTLGTGRTHQIRIHLAGAGCPILGDDRYGDFAANRAAARHMAVKRLCLAACSLTIPLAGERRTFTVDLPEHMRRAITEIFEK